MQQGSLEDELNFLHDKYNNFDFIENDPISIPHSFKLREDIEISGFLSATIAWGNRKTIVKNCRRLMSLMDDSPYDFIMNASQSELCRFDGFVHRTFNNCDCVDFVIALRNMYNKFGGIGVFFEREFADSADMRAVFSRFRKEFFNFPHSLHSEKHLSSIDNGSACKRLNMYVRWMVRNDDRGVEFGLWKTIKSSALYLPLDVHSATVGRLMGLLCRRSNDWMAVEEITARLREFDASDPVKYDFALFGAGIDGFFNGKSGK